MAFMVWFEDDEGFAHVVRQWRRALEIPMDMSHAESLIVQGRLYGVRVAAGYVPAVVEEAVRGLLLSEPLIQSGPTEGQALPGHAEAEMQRAG